MSKTIRISELKEEVNRRLALDTGVLDASGRKAIADLMADLLHKTDNYMGFTYLPTESNLHADHYGKDGRVRFC